VKFKEHDLVLYRRPKMPSTYRYYDIMSQGRTVPRFAVAE
jgi:hypothetical protein